MTTTHEAVSPAAVIGVVLALGFLLLLVALQAPLVSALGVLTNLLATAAAFGVAKLVFQDDHGSGLLGFSLLLAVTVSPRFLLLTTFVGVNQLVFVLAGSCPASLAIDRVRGTRELTAC